MDFNEYFVVITNKAYKEMEQINYHIAEELYAENAAKRLMELIEKKYID